MNLGKMPTQEEWDEWKAHPCTKRLIHWAESSREELKELWASGFFTAAFDVEMAVKNAGATGACSVHAELIDMSYDKIVEGVSNEEQQVGANPPG